MKKNKTISSLIGMMCIAPSCMMFTSCSSNYQKDTNQCTIKFQATEGVELVGETIYQVAKGTKYKDIKLPEIKIDTLGALSFGWVNESTKLFVDFSSDEEITTDLSFTYLVRTASNSTTLVMYDKDRKTWINEQYFVRGYPFKTLKSYYGTFIPELDYRYKFIGWKDKNNELIRDETILDLEEIRVYAFCEWIGPSINFGHNKYAKLKSGYVEPDPIPIDKNGVKWSAWKQTLASTGLLPEYTNTNDGSTNEDYWVWFDQTTGENITDDTIVSSKQDFRPTLIIPPSSADLTFNFVTKKQNFDGTYSSVSSPEYHTISGYSLYQILSDIQYQKDASPVYKTCKWYFDENCTNEVQLTDLISEGTEGSKSITLYNKYDMQEFCLNSTTWSSIVETTAKGLESLKQQFNVTSFVGFERQLNLFNQKYTVRVIGENHDEYADGTGNAPLTYELKEVVTDDNGNPLTTVASWNDVGFFPSENLLSVLNQQTGTVCWYEQDSKTVSTKYNKSCINGLSNNDNGDFNLGEKIKPIKKSVYKKSTAPQEAILTSYSGKLFPISTIENATHCPCPLYHYVFEAGKTYEYYQNHKTNMDRIKYTNAISESVATKPVSYWLGQPAMYSDDKITPTFEKLDYQVIIDVSGSVETKQCKTMGEIGVSFAFCL